MSASPPPPPPFLSRQPAPPETSLTNKIFTFAAIGMGVGFGTCSIAGLTAGGHPFIGYFIGIGAGLFFASLAILLLTGLYILVVAIIRSFKQ
jgi:hypothetical protein